MICDVFSTLLMQMKMIKTTKGTISESTDKTPPRVSATMPTGSRLWRKAWPFRCLRSPPAPKPPCRGRRGWLARGHKRGSSSPGRECLQPLIKKGYFDGPWAQWFLAQSGTCRAENFGTEMIVTGEFQTTHYKKKSKIQLNCICYILNYFTYMATNCL